MKKLAINLVFVLSIFSSCDKCKDTNCNHGTCSRGDGKCYCDQFYTGDDCSISVKSFGLSKYLGKYEGKLTTTSPVLNPYTVKIDSNEEKGELELLLRMGFGSSYTMNFSSSTNFSLSLKENVGFLESSSGSGTVDSLNLRFNIKTITFTENEIQESFVGTRK